MNIETILAVVVAIMTGGFGVFQMLARKRVEKLYVGTIKNTVGRSKKELLDAKKKSSNAIADYKRRRDTRKK